mmetsp:Transcript_13212/g.17402  ORF Transcript_13212/g.17402 Transcript_13212/m.17402 type:complete len:94 (-) Transcript_13212:97-378(-)
MNILVFLISPSDRRHSTDTALIAMKPNFPFRLLSLQEKVDVVLRKRLHKRNSAPPSTAMSKRPPKISCCYEHLIIYKFPEAGNQLISNVFSRS